MAEGFEMSLALDYEIVHLREQLEQKEARIAELEAHNTSHRDAL